MQHKMPDGKNSLLPANMKRPATGRRTSLTSDPSRGMFVFDNKVKSAQLCLLHSLRPQTTKYGCTRFLRVLRIYLQSVGVFHMMSLETWVNISKALCALVYLQAPWYIQHQRKISAEKTFLEYMLFCFRMWPLEHNTWLYLLYRIS